MALSQQQENPIWKIAHFLEAALGNDPVDGSGSGALVTANSIDLEEPVPPQQGKAPQNQRLLLHS